MNKKEHKIWKEIKYDEYLIYKINYKFFRGSLNNKIG